MRLLTPFPLEHAHALPVTGEHHPLRREYQRWMSMGNAIVMLLVVTSGCAYLLLQRDPAPLPVKIPTTHKIGPPISIVDGTRKQINANVVDQTKVGIPVPVPDVRDQAPSFPTQEELAKALGAIDIPTVTDGSGPPIVLKEETLPTADQFVAVEVLPELLRMEAPVYPPLAREAGVEGTVLLRVLVSKEGKVLNVIVLSGNPMLTDAARTAAFTARFSPAQQQHKPVPVWVQLPVVFSLD